MKRKNINAMHVNVDRIIHRIKTVKGMQKGILENAFSCQDVNAKYEVRRDS